MNQKKKLELTPRLQALADWVRPGARIADVGTDHGYLPIWLLLRGRITTAIASDLRVGPLERGRRDAADYGVDQEIDFRRCDGLAGIAPEEADTIVVAGMGGENIAQILASAPWTADGRHTLLLQPQSRPETLRGFLADNGYTIVREALVEDRGRLYPVMEARAGEMRLSKGQLYCGARLVQDPLGERYIIEKIIQLQGIIVGRSRSEDPAERVQADAQREVLTDLLVMREEWRHANHSGN